MPASRTRRLILMCLLFPSAAARADDADSAVPTVGRPADLPFSGASGDFRVWADAEPKAVEAQHPLTLTLHIKARAEVRHPPERIDLRVLAPYKGRFDFPEADAGEERRPDAHTWEFVYRLQPKSEDVAELPGIPFVFYNPEIQYPRKGFQVAYTDPIPLTVKPHEVFHPPLVGPEFAFAAAPSTAILGDGRPWAPPGPWSVGALALAPPLLCAGWYFAWRRLYPDAARLALRRRSLAARRALQALRDAARLPAPARAARTAAAAAEYLRVRFDAPAAEPTPAEAADWLGRAGCPSSLAEQAAAFFRDCDAARFAPDGAATDADLPAAATRFILAVEAEKWSPSRS